MIDILDFFFFGGETTYGGLETFREDKTHYFIS